jgi:SAM-dependent methyltransferase
MKLGAVPENFAERLGLLFGVVPPGIMESWLGIMVARAMMTATKLDVFESLANGPLTADEVADRCRTYPRATKQLLNALVGVGCLTVKGKRYAMRRSFRSWILKDAKSSLRGHVLFHYLEWRWWEHCEEYVRTGKPLRVHETMSAEEWGIYQQGMRSGSAMHADWIAKQLPLPVGARTMLDVGGSHGYFSVALCRQHPQLRATVLDLPEAINQAAELLAKEGMGDRVVHRAGNALTDELGAEGYDLIFMASLVHHFDAATNRQLMGRIARALRPGGIAAIWEPAPQDDGAGKVRQMGAFFDLYFGFTSEAGVWSAAEVADWFRQAGLEVQKPRHPWIMPELALHVGRKPP